jgi:formate dehydrogenase maturation protein FdhE
METTYSEWKFVIRPDGLKEVHFCPVCKRSVASMMHRYGTDGNGERFEQFRVECQICDQKGKVYRNKRVALLSWDGQEQLGNKFELPPVTRRRRYNEK